MIIILIIFGYLICAAIFTAVANHKNLTDNVDSLIFAGIAWPLAITYFLTIFLLEKYDELKESEED